MNKNVKNRIKSLEASNAKHKKNSDLNIRKVQVKNHFILKVAFPLYLTVLCFVFLLKKKRLPALKKILLPVSNVTKM
jgi:hypothetical protein